MESRDDAGSGGAVEGEDADGLALLWRFMPVRIELATLAPAFGGEEEAGAALLDLGKLFREVSNQEREHLDNMVLNVSQFLLILGARPVPENGEQLRKYIQIVRQNIEFRAGWPMRPIEDFRRGTALQNTDHFVFEHKTEGLIRLQWVNPLPKPAWMSGGGFQCDVCMDPDLRVGYQHVTEDNERDSSSFFVHRIGFDVCAPCAVKHVEQRRESVRAFLAGTRRGCRELSRRPWAAAAGAPPELQMQVKSFGVASASGGVEAEVEVQGTGGWHVAVSVLPVVSAGEEQVLPACWLTTGSLLPASQQGGGGTAIAAGTPADDAAPASEVEFQCASGDRLRVCAAPARGSLLLHRSEGEPAPFRALTFSERAPDFECVEGDATMAGSSEKLPHLAFQGTSRGAWLRADDKRRVLGALRGLASRAGVAHNIPAQELEEAPALVERPRMRSSSSGVGSCSGEGDSDPCFVGDGIGYLLPPDWADLHDCMICLDALGECTWLRGAPLSTRCGHLFHANCLRKHLRSSTDGNKTGLVCPNCRADDPLRDAKPLGGSGSLRWTLARDGAARPLEEGRCYLLTAILCQDPKAVVDTAVVLACTCLQAGDACEASA
eukprot:TRINITY_DN2450_c0_g1_i1.p2 TRINITY_DN2450_c0_g1~~TRINITY_DN2450_c0_g1_i1.p2  ORF type:complete len:607 (-),score=160.04 TRINITY_DN2450_c0_g1_i1:68-1888(-)